MTRQEALGRLLELEDYFCRRFADAPMESEEEAEAYKHARAVKDAILLLAKEESDAENLSAAAAASPPEGETRGEAAGGESMTDRDVVDALGEMEVYFVQCYASASVGGRAEKRFGRYIAALKQAKDIVKERETAENKEEKTHDK